MDRNPTKWLTVLATGPNLVCGRRVSVNFMEDLYSICQYVVARNQTSPNCNYLKQDILSLILGPLNSDDKKFRIGMFGASNVNNSQEWITPMISDELRFPTIGKEIGARHNVNITTESIIYLLY